MNTHGEASRPHVERIDLGIARAARLREPARTRFLEAVPDDARCLGLALVWWLQ